MIPLNVLTAWLPDNDHLSDNIRALSGQARQALLHMLNGICMNKFPTQTPNAIQGFTLLEAMITVLVGAILMSLAVSSFNFMVQTNRLTTQANEFSTTVNLARSESIKRGQTITVTSNSGTNWANGWVLTVTSSGEVLRRTPAMDGDTTFTSGSNSSVTFDSRGFSTLVSEELFTLCNTNLTKGRRVRIAVTGRISVQEISPCS